MPCSKKYSKYRLQPTQPLLARLKMAITACGGKQTDIAASLGLSPAYVCKLIQANDLQADIKAARGDRKSVSRKQKQRRPLGDNHPLVKKLKAAIITCEGKQTEVAKIFNLSTPEISKLIQANHLRDFAAAVRKAKRKKQKIATLEPASILMEMRRQDEVNAIPPQYVMMLPGMYSTQLQAQLLQQMQQGNFSFSVGNSMLPRNGPATPQYPVIQPVPMQEEQIAAAQKNISMLNAFAALTQNKLQQQNLGKVRDRFQNVHIYSKEKEKNTLSRKRKFPSSKTAEGDLVAAQRKLQEAQNKLFEMQTKRREISAQTPLLSLGLNSVTNSVKTNTTSTQGKQSHMQMKNNTATVQCKQTEMQAKRPKMPAPQASLSRSPAMDSVDTHNQSERTGKSNAESNRHQPDTKKTMDDDVLMKKPGLPTSSSAGRNTQSVEVQLSPRHASRRAKATSNDIKNNNTPQVIPHNVHVSHHDHMIYSSSDSSHDGALRSTSTNMGQQYSIMI